jgi:hypothetical protein
LTGVAVFCYIINIEGKHGMKFWTIVLAAFGFEALGEAVESLSGLEGLDGELLGEVISETVRVGLELAGFVVASVVGAAGCSAETASWSIVDGQLSGLKIGVVIIIGVVAWIRARRSGRR